MSKGVFQFIANRIFEHIGYCKVISCGLIINKLERHMSLDCEVLECEDSHILVRVNMCGDIAIYKITINDNKCVEFVEIVEVLT